MIVGVLKYRVRYEGFPTKAQRPDSIGDDACGCYYPLVGVVVDTFTASRLRVKTFDYYLDNGSVRRRYLLGGIVAEFQFCSSVTGGKFLYFVVSP